MTTSPLAAALRLKRGKRPRSYTIFDQVLERIHMNRKEIACAAVSVLLGAGCSPATKSLATPADTQGGPLIPAAPSAASQPHLTDALLSLISGTSKDIGSAIFRLLPKSGWSIKSNDPRLHVEIQNGHVAIVSAPENKTINFIATAVISHADGEEFHVRCHVEAGCDAADPS